MSSQISVKRKGKQARVAVLTTMLGALVVGTWLAVFIPLLLAKSQSLNSSWFWLAPGWGLLKPGRDDGALIIWSIVITALVYALLIFPLLYLLVKRIVSMR